MGCYLLSMYVAKPNIGSWTNTLPTLTCWLEGARERESGTCDWRPLTRFIVYWYLSSYLDWGSLDGTVCGRAGRRLWNIREPVLCGLCCNVKYLVVWFDGQVSMSRGAISDRNKMTKKLEYLNFEGFRIWRGISLLRPFFSSTFSLCDHDSINYIYFNINGVVDIRPIHKLFNFQMSLFFENEINLTRKQRNSSIFISI